MEIRKYFIKFSMLDWIYMKIIRPIGYLVGIYPVELVNMILIKLNIIKKYKYLKKYKNINKGKRCFIIGTGPSLTIEDYKLLKNDLTLGVNALCLWFNKESKTNYFFISDKYAYLKLKNDIPEDTFISNYVAKKCDIRENKYQKVNVSRYNYFCDFFPKISKDFSTCTYDFNSVIFMAIQFAIYTGVNEIYLLGVDCNYNKKNIYAVDHGIRHKKQYMNNVGEQMIKNYQKMKMFCDKNNVKIYNASRGGDLEVFNRVNLENIIKEKE